MATVDNSKLKEALIAHLSDPGKFVKVNYEALRFSELSSGEDLICVPGEPTMANAIVFAMGANAGAVKAEERFTFTEAKNFDGLWGADTWCVRRSYVEVR